MTEMNETQMDAVVGGEDCLTVLVATTTIGFFGGPLGLLAGAIVGISYCKAVGEI